MLSYLLRKLLLSIPVLFGVTVIVFAIAHAMPGDAVLASSRRRRRRARN